MAAPVTVIEPSRGWAPLRLGLLWSFRELGWFLVWRELKLRYKQTLLGGAWALLQPALTAVLLAVLFGRLAGLPSEGVPYLLFAFAGIVPWTYFSQATSQASRSVVSGASLVSRVYFPRLLLPLGSALSFLVELAATTGLLLVVMALYGYEPTLRTLALPGVVALLLAAALGASFLFAATNAQYRDVQYGVPFLLQLGLFASPILYPLSLIPVAWQPVYALNPMVAVIELFRWALLATPFPSGAVLAVSIPTGLLLLVAGSFYFRRLERTLADVV
jgi:lipopolysaccharide transport system permease protein